MTNIGEDEIKSYANEAMIIAIYKGLYNDYDEIIKMIQEVSRRNKDHWVPYLVIEPISGDIYVIADSKFIGEFYKKLIRLYDPETLLVDTFDTDWANAFQGEEGKKYTFSAYICKNCHHRRGDEYEPPIKKIKSRNLGIDDPNDWE